MGSKPHSKCPFMLLLHILCQITLSAAATMLPQVSYMPELVQDLVEGGNKSVLVTFSFTRNVYLSEVSRKNPWKMDVRATDNEVVKIDDGGGRSYNLDDFAYNNNSRFYSLETVIVIRGSFLGKSSVRARLVPANWFESPVDVYKEDESVTHSDGLNVWVKRSPDSVWLTKMFVSTLVVLISLANVIMGCELDLSVVASTIRRPVAPLIGLFTQFLVMPLLAYAIGKVVFVSRDLHPFALGLFVTGCAPGGGASNFWTILLDGNVNLSVTMTFLSTLASFVMMPLWISLLGVDFLQGFSSDTRMRVPYSRIVSSLVSLVGPLLIGVAIARLKPDWAARAKKMMRPFIIFVLLFVIVFGCIANSYMWKLMTWPAVLGGLLLPWCGFMFGCGTSILFRRPPGDVTAIAIETGIQNTGIAILMLKWSFPEPDCDISSLIPVIVACFTPGPLLLGAAIHLTLKAFQNKKEKNMELIEKEEQELMKGEKEMMSLCMELEEKKEIEVMPLSILKEEEC